MKLMTISLAIIAAIGTTAASAGSWYVDAKAGQSIADVPPVSSAYSWDDSSSTYELVLGYRLTDRIALEGGYTSMIGYALNRNNSLTGTLITGGKTFVATGATYKHTYDVDGFTLGANFSIPVSPSIEAGIRGGILYWSIQSALLPTRGTLTHAGTAYTTGSSIDLNGFNGNDPYLGVTASYKINEAMQLGVGFTRWFVTVDSTDVDVDTWTANIRYAF